MAFVILIAGSKNVEAAVSANGNNFSYDTYFLIIQDYNLWCKILADNYRLSLTDN